jgi:hypothetical protein
VICHPRGLAPQQRRQMFREREVPWLAPL